MNRFERSFAGEGSLQNNLKVRTCGFIEVSAAGDDSIRVFVGVKTPENFCPRAAALSKHYNRLNRNYNCHSGIDETCIHCRVSFFQAYSEMLAHQEQKKKLLSDRNIDIS